MSAAQGPLQTSAVYTIRLGTVWSADDILLLSGGEVKQETGWLRFQRIRCFMLYGGKGNIFGMFTRVTH